MAIAVRETNYNEQVIRLIINYQKTYPQSPIIKQEKVSNNSGGLVSGDQIDFRGFMGSDNVVSLSSISITLQPPAYVAAPLVSLVAKNSIFLGIEKPIFPNISAARITPVCLYAPQQLSIVTKCFWIGNVQLTVVPERATVSCEELIIDSADGRDSAFVTAVKDWFIDSEDVNISYRP